MNTEWRQLLEQAGAEFEDEKILSFGDSSAELSAITEGPVMAPLTSYGLVRVSGTDALSFLQGQTSNDVAVVDATHSQLTSYNQPKGRMLAFFRLFQIGEDYYLRLPRELIDATINRMRMFVMRSNVVLADVSNDFVVLGIADAESKAIFKERDMLIPQEDAAVIQSNGLTLIKGFGEPWRVEVIGGEMEMIDLWNACAARVRTVGEPAWDLLEIRAGMPEVYASTRETFVPQMANLQKVNAISFTKGCYPGQEIVARMHYLGTLKKRSYHFFISGETAPQPGDKIFDADKPGGQSLGNVIRVAPSPRGGFEGLAAIQISAVENTRLTIGERHNILVISDPPYGFD